MAGKKKSEIFNMDDGTEETGLGGLNDAPEIPEEEIEFMDHVVLDDDPSDEEPVIEEEGEPEGDETPEPEPEEEPEEPEESEDSEPEEEPEPLIDPEEERFNRIAAMLAKKDEQIESLVDQVKALTEKVIAPEPKKEVEERTPPTPPDSEEMDWNEYVDAKLAYEKDLAAYESDIKAKEEAIRNTELEAKQAKASEELQAIHEKDYADEAEELPILRDNETVRKVWSEIFYNPETGYSAKPDGVLRATRALKRKAKEDGIDLYNFGKKPEPTPEPTPEKVKADEEARKKRVDSGAMQDGSKTTTTEKAQPTIDVIETAKKFGVKPETLMKTMSALKGKK